MNTAAPDSDEATNLPQLRDSTVCVVGLGLMGGSLALALRHHVRALHAVDRDPATVRRALDKQIVQLASTDLGRGIADAGIIVLAAPVRTNLELLTRIAPIAQPETLIIDLSSTKVDIVAAMNRLPEHLCAVGGHPMCGKEVSGVDYADAGLFVGRRFVLCPTERTTPSSMRQATELVTATGAHPLPMAAEEHDHSVAWTSHLPYLVSAALARSCAALPPAAMQLTASGFRDTSRLAGSDPAMMTDILLTNRPGVREALRRARAELELLAHLLDHAEGPQLREHLAGAQAARAAWQARVATEAAGATQPEGEVSTDG